MANLQLRLADEHADATLMVNAAGFFVPKAFLDYDADFYDSYLSLNYCCFFDPNGGAHNDCQRGGSVVFVGSMWAHQAIGLTPSSGIRCKRQVCMP